MIKVGMVGMGGISRSHRNAWKQVEGAQIVCVCDIRPQNAEDAAKDTGATPYTDFDTMLANEKFDILDICLPTYLHADFAVKAMDHGLHTITEKPISLKKEDVQRVYAAAKRNNVRFMVAHVLRFWREYIYLKDAIDSGRFGKVLSGQMTRLGNTPKWSWDNWMRDPERSGLVPFDLHIHDLDFMVYQFGRPNSVKCHRAGNAKQDYINVVYQYDDFFIACESAWYDADFSFTSGFRFQFEEAVLESKAGVLTVYHSNGETEVVGADTKTTGDNGINLPPTNAYYNEIQYFTDCVRAGKDCDIIQPEELEIVLDLIDQLHN